MEARPNGDTFSNIVPVGVAGDLSLEINKRMYDRSTDLQSVFTNTHEKFRKKQNDFDGVQFKNYYMILNKIFMNHNQEKLNQLDINLIKIF